VGGGSHKVHIGFACIDVVNSFKGKEWCGISVNHAEEVCSGFLGHFLADW